MKKTIAARNGSGHIITVYFLASEDILTRETIFTKDEWERGIARWQWDAHVSKEVGDQWEVIGNEVEDIGSGYLYRVFFAKQGSFVTRSANEIIEEYLQKWELE